MSTTESITKIQAAERQLRVAIQLFFDRGDLVAILTLTSAAGRVLRDMGRHRGIASPFCDSDYIRPDRRKEFIEILNRAPNFFKHADKDPDEILAFHPESVPFEIFEAVLMYATIGQVWSPEALVFFSWFALKYPLILKPEVLAKLAGATVPSDVDVDDFTIPREAIRLARKTEEAKRRQ
jgi:hypothetical protein